MPCCCCNNVSTSICTQVATGLCARHLTTGVGQKVQVGKTSGDLETSNVSCLDHFESNVEIQEHEDDTREEEAARQKEFLEKVVISQKGQLRQLEKVGKISDGQW